jgi:hypothetical protein
MSVYAYYGHDRLRECSALTDHDIVLTTIKSGVTGGWTSRDYNFQIISSSASSSSEEDGASPSEHPDDQGMLSPRLGYFYRLGVEELNYTICTNF